MGAGGFTRTALFGSFWVLFWHAGLLSQNLCHALIYNLPLPVTVLVQGNECSRAVAAATSSAPGIP